MKVKFTINYIDGLKPSDKRYEVQDTLFPHLTIRVSPSGVKSYYILYRDSGGTLRRVKIGDAKIITPTQARETAQRVLAEITTTGVDPRDKTEKEEPTLQGLVDMYKAAGGSEYSVYTVERVYVDLLPEPVSSITQVDIETRREKRRKETGVTCATVNKGVGSLKAILNWAAVRGIIPENPIRNLRKLKEVDSATKTRYLTDKERKRLLEVIENKTNHIKPLIIVALNTGIRQGALFALKWEDIDFAEKTISLGAKNAKSKKHSIIPANKAAIDALLAWREVLQQKKVKSDLVFPSPRNGRKMNNVCVVWAKIMEKANIKDFRFHDMRHDFASQLVMKGVDLNTVRELLAHSDIKMTMRYAHLAPEAKRSAVSLLDKVEETEEKK